MNSRTVAPSRPSVDPARPVGPAVLERAREIMRRPYHKVIVGETDGGFLARVTEFDGCMTAGETEAEALELLRDAMELWLIVAIEDELPIPEPAPELAGVSGHVLLRMPKSLHRRLLERAEEEGCSANQLAVSILARGL